MNATPVSLLQRLRQPDDLQAWERFVFLYEPMLFSWSLRLGMQEADASDFVQDVFAVLLRRLPEFQYDPSFRFRQWLRTVTLNLWRDQLKRRAVPQSVGAAPILEERPGADQLETMIENEHNAHLLRRAMDILTADFQPSTWQAFWQVTIEDRPPAAVAQSLGLTVAAVYAAKHRILARLRQELVGLYP